MRATTYPSLLFIDGDQADAMIARGSTQEVYAAR